MKLWLEGKKEKEFCLKEEIFLSFSWKFFFNFLVSIAFFLFLSLSPSFCFESREERERRESERKGYILLCYFLFPSFLYFAHCWMKEWLIIGFLVLGCFVWIEEWAGRRRRGKGKGKYLFFFLIFISHLGIWFVLLVALWSG